jgi:type II secretory ATPase GspE/PulE/Tfp pilus assembly ATPase PilB-like protein
MGVKDSVLGRLAGNADKFTDEQVAQMLDMLVARGVKREASGIHLEPHEQFVQVRFRIGNVLRNTHKLPRAALLKVMQQLKLRADLDPLDAHTPQDGQFEVLVDEQPVAVDVSVMPVLGGEKAVLHLAPRLGKPAELESLGFWGDNLQQVRQALTHPHGLILAAGPRHAGLSTTLHALLDLLHTPMVSIATVEKRARHTIPGATHVQTGGHDTVHESLQATLRQDPNIVMVDRLPDKATTELAIQGALQGHLILAGMHSDGAVSGLLHVRNWGGEPFLLASTLRLCIGQRLVRRLCPDCRERHEIDEAEREHLERTLDISSPAKRRRVHELEQAALRAGMGEGEPPSSTTAHITHLWRAKPAGCESCDHTGYRGHVALVEVLQNTDAIQKQLLAPHTPTIQTVHQAALKDGFIPLALDGLIKSLRGETTVEEVLRVAAP